MTLILTTLCKDGICVCADKRNRTWDSSGNKINEDSLNKIFRFKDAPFLMFNHGVNKFGNDNWRSLCSEYESTECWKAKKLKDIALDFKKFVEKRILNQLIQNAKNFPDNASVRASAFVLCGKDLLTNRLEFHEMFWSPKFTFTSWQDTRLIGSGEGYKNYLEEYLRLSSEQNSVEYWGSLNLYQVREKLKQLFSIAIQEQKKKNGDDFSENYDIECECID